MRQTILAVLCCNLALLAADVSGAWSGTVKMKRDGGDHANSAHMILKQSGETVTGTIGTHTDDQRPIENGKVQGDRVTFDVGTNNGSYKVSLKMQEGGESLSGEVLGEGNETVAQLELKRAK